MAGLRRREWTLELLAVVTGLGAGLGAIAFRYLILAITRLFTGTDDFSAAGRVPNPHLAGLGAAFLLLVPVAGGLIYGPLIYLFAREARGHGVPEVMLAVSEQGGRIRPRVALVKALASALCIGSGGSVGREGPIVQIGAALGSTMGQLVRLPASRLRLLVASGAAAGIAATFNAPIGGAFFGLELILRDFELRSFSAVVLAAVTATAVGRAAFGSGAFLPMAPFELASGWEYPLYALLGLLAAVVAVTFIRVLYGTEDICDRLWKGWPEWLRPAAGGLLLGGLLLALPQMYGVGYPVLQHAIEASYAWWFMLVLLACKMLATSLTIGIGGSGGVFAPSLFLGGMLGSGFGMLVGRVLPFATAPAGAYGIVGMGAVFAAAAQAPITSIVMLFELTDEYRIVPAVMLAVIAATALGRLLSPETIYTLKLRRRGIVVASSTGRMLQRVTARDAMRPPPVIIRHDQNVDEIAAALAAAATSAAPVVDSGGRLLGIVRSQDIEQQLPAQPGVTLIAGDLAIGAPVIHRDTPLEEAIAGLLVEDSAGVPIVESDGRPVGWLTHVDVLRAYDRARQAQRQP